MQVSRLGHGSGERGSAWTGARGTGRAREEHDAAGTYELVEGEERKCSCAKSILVGSRIRARRFRSIAQALYTLQDTMVDPARSR